MKTIVRAIALLGVTAPAFAQQATSLERVEITGSSIKRVQTEGATPVQTITREEIDRNGIVSAEQLIMRITANGNGADNLSSNVGIQLGLTHRNDNGNSSANLRGLGSTSTLVLLNGRRIPAHGAKGNSADLNWIPLALVERVEVLKDGASATYGTDAIGGVINFILRKDYTGFEVTGFTDITEQGGGNIYRGSLLGGIGNLERDRYNLMGSLTFDKQDKLAGNQRSFANGFQPERGLSPDTAGAPFASQTGLAGTAIGATFTVPGNGTQTFNRANLLSFQGKCDSVPTMSQYQFALWNAPGARYACAYDYGGAEILIQPIERTNFVGRGSFALSNDHTAFIETVATRSVATKQFEPYQITTTGAIAGAQYPVNGPYYQDLSAYIPGFNKNLPIAYRWRCNDCGPRTIETTTDAYRVLMGLEGTLAGRWDYKTGLSTSGSKATSVMEAGFMYQTPMVAALGSGQVNPWLLPGQSQSAAGASLLNGARADGAKLFAGKSRMSEFDGTISGELFKLPAGPLAAAVGFDLRRESYEFSDGSRTVQPIYQAPFDAEFPKVGRTIKAVFGELAVPIIKGMEATLAVRHDDYSDFGGTTNPKLALKYSPVEQLLLRGSYNTGFRAPSFYQLYSAQGDSPVPGNIADPYLCPNGPVAGADLSVCAIRPNARTGGNKDLQPETSKQWSVGFVVTPTNWMSVGVDMWQIKRSDLIYELTAQQVIANYTTFPNNFFYGAGNRLDGTGGYIRAGYVNADGDITRGTDLSVQMNGVAANGKWTAGLEGTYMDSHKSRIFASQPYVETVGQWDPSNLFVRWKHQLSFSYTRGVWSGMVSQSYTAGYRDERPVGTVPAGFNPDVSPYKTYNVAATYTGIKNLTITAGIKNLFDTDPPFTAHNLDFAAGAGWDPRIADPRGRAYTLRVNYKFF